MPGLIEPPKYNDDEAYNVNPLYNVINDINDHLITNVFCFGAFADKNLAFVYNDCTGEFPFMSLDGNVCLFVMYHYKTNAILATPIPGLDSGSILKAYKKNFEYLENKGYKPKLNVMDNQSTKVIMAYLTPQQVSLQLAEPHNHHINAAERALDVQKLIHRHAWHERHQFPHPIVG